MPTKSRLLTRVLIAAALAVTVIAAVAGCGSAVNQQATASADQGVLRVATDADLTPSTLFAGGDSNRILIGQVYDTLVTYPAETFTPQPSLATSWKLAPDRESISIQLREGVKYSNGAEFTAKDVEASIKAYAEPEWTAQMLLTAAAITGFESSDSHQITLKFAHPLGNIFDLLDQVPMLEAKSINAVAAGKSFIGTGPFTVAGWTPNSKLVFKANPNYWGGKPSIEEVVLSTTITPEAQVSQLRSGQFDVILDAEGRDVHQLGSESGFQVLALKGTEQGTYVGMNVADKALANPKLREAVADAIDRKRIAEDVYEGAAAPGVLPWPSYSPAYSASENQKFERDVPGAKQLVGEMGSVPTLPIQYSSEISNMGNIAQIVQSNLEEVGIKSKLEPLQGAQFGPLLIEGKFSALWIAPNEFGQFTPGTLSISAYPFNAEKNASNYVSPEYKAAATAAWEVDPESPAAAGVYKKLNQSLLAGNFLTELVTVTPQMVAAADVDGLTWGKRSPELHFAKATIGG